MPEQSAEIGAAGDENILKWDGVTDDCAEAGRKGSGSWQVDVEAITKFSSGATFFRGDLHVHSYRASHDVSDVLATPKNIVELACREGLRLLALADHNEISNVSEAVQEGNAAGLLVIPAVELSTPEGHLLCYARDSDSLEAFYGKLRIADRRTKNSRCQTGMTECLNHLRDVGGFAILAHVELDGAFEANLPRLTPAKLDILCHPALMGFEVTRADCPIRYDDADMDNNRKTALSRRRERLKLGSYQILARVLNSDAHSLSAVGRNAKNDQRITRYKMEQPSFEGLRLALDAADTRVRLEDEVPSFVPIIQGVHFSGGFLDDQAVHFSPNLTCIIGGRGSGKSTAFEGLRLLDGRRSSEPATVVDSDVWPDSVTLMYRDETSKVHVLARSKCGEVENIDDPVTGAVSFPIESYRQGETNDISKRVQDDPLALLTFLDRLVDVSEAIAEEDALRAQLNELAPQLRESQLNVTKIPEYERELKLKRDQVARLKSDKAEDLIRLQQKLEGERRARTAVQSSLAQLTGKITHDAILEITSAIKESVGTGVIDLAEPEAAQIRSDTEAYEASVSGASAGLLRTTNEYAVKVRAQVASWRAKEAQTVAAIEAKKNELLAHGIQLDMLFIQRLVADEARAEQSLRNLKTWIPGLTRRTAEHKELLQKRWAARNRVSALRKAFGTRASNALRGTLSDLFVSLKFDESGLGPDAEILISDVMSWRTLQQLKAGALIKDLTLPKLLECVRQKNTGPVLALKNDKGAPVFAQSSEVEALLERLAEPDLLSKLETIAVYDMPKLSVTKRIETPGNTPRFIPRDFKRLSLGQQQSVLLALMLMSESSCPLIVDQPEDNLDSEFIYKTLVPVIRSAKERRQIIVVTHNANIAVLGDAEEIVALKATNEKASIVARGSIDEPSTNRIACAILEGSPEAFERRGRIYGIDSN